MRTYTADEVDAMIARALAREREAQQQEPLNRVDVACDIKTLCANGDLPDRFEEVAEWVAAGSMPAQQQEPVAICEYCEKERPVIQAEGKPWVGLTDEEIIRCIVHHRFEYDPPYVEKNGTKWLAEYVIQPGPTYRNIEAKLKEKNT